MQLRFPTGHTSEDDVSRQAWRNASLPRCPRHPHGGCGFGRHGTYARKSPPGTRIARWYCRRAHQTFSLLPDFLAARLTETLHALEDVVLAVEQAPSLEAFGLPAERNRAEVTRLVTEAKQQPVLIVDEAHHLRNDVLEDLRLLTNYHMDAHNRLCLLLIGLTDLRRRLAMVVHETLDQRIVVRHHLPGLARDELEPGVVDEIRQATNGNYALGSERFRQQVLEGGDTFDVLTFCSTSYEDVLVPSH